MTSPRFKPGDTVYLWSETDPIWDASGPYEVVEIEEWRNSGGVGYILQDRVSRDVFAWGCDLMTLDEVRRMAVRDIDQCLNLYLTLCETGELNGV